MDLKIYVFCVISISVQDTNTSFANKSLYIFYIFVKICFFLSCVPTGFCVNFHKVFFSLLGVCPERQLLLPLLRPAAEKLLRV
jgi:hypothetical protein